MNIKHPPLQKCFKAAFLLIQFSLFSYCLFSQQKKVDSLKLITQKGTDKEKANAFNKLCELVMYDKPEEGKFYARQAIKLSNDIDYSLGIADGYNNIGIVYDVSGKYDSSIYYYEKALPIFNEIKDIKGRGSAINNLGLIYWNMGDYDKAIDNFFKALKDFESIKNNAFMANALNNIGLVYADVKNYKQSLQYHLKAKVIYEKMNDDYLKGAVYNNLGNVYSNLSHIDSAEIYYKMAIDMQAKAKDAYGLSIAYNGYAGTLFDRKDYTNALVYFNKALVIKKDIAEKVGEASVLKHMADVYDSIGNKELELKCLSEAKDIAEKNGFKKELISIYKKLSEFYQKNDLPLSYEYFKKYNAVKDSVFNETSNEQITELNTKYETQKKEQQLKVQGLEIKQKNYLLWGFASVGLLLIAAGFGFYNRKQLKDKLLFQQAMMKQQDMATKAVINAEENERKRIAADLHDGVGQIMSAAKMNLSVFENELTFKDEEQKRSFEKIISLVDESCKEVRSVSHQMMPNALLKSGLSSAVKEFIEKIDSRVVKVSLHTEGLSEKIDDNTEIILYRVIQECVNNVLKHSGADQLDISIIKDKDGISSTIEDNGKGFDSSDKQHFDGIGLKNIISRIAYLKGTIDFDSARGKGTLVAIHVPFG